MIGQNDWQDQSLTGQVRDQAGHCPLTGRYFQPCKGRVVTFSLGVGGCHSGLKVMGMMMMMMGKFNLYWSVLRVVKL